MKVMLDKFKEYEEAKRKLSKVIGFDITLDVKIYDEVKWSWYEQDSEVRWSDAGGFYYEAHAVSVGEFKDCYLFKICHYAGGNHYVVFLKENKVNELFD